MVLSEVGKNNLIANLNHHLNTANAEYQQLKMTANKLLGGDLPFPMDVTRKKTEVDQRLANPCE